MSIEGFFFLFVSKSILYYMKLYAFKKEKTFFLFHNVYTANRRKKIIQFIEDYATNKSRAKLFSQIIALGLNKSNEIYNNGTRVISERSLE
jgi:hypothetical protein